MTPNSSEVDTTSGQQQHDASLHQLPGQICSVVSTWPTVISRAPSATGRRMAEIVRHESFERVIESMSEALS